jgi:hypothetical protein
MRSTFEVFPISATESQVTFITKRRYYRGFWLSNGFFRLWGNPTTQGVHCSSKRDLAVYLASLPANLTA